MTASIDIRALSRTFHDIKALDRIDLHVEAGEYCVLLGPSGCGKTTLLNIIGGFADPTRGDVRIGGRSMVGVPAAHRPTTTVFQDYALFPHMRLLDNVAFGLRMRKVAKGPREDRARRMLDLVGLPGAEGKSPGELSGGQRQRVALARALAVEPDVLLLDEPLGALDLNLRRSMQEELKAIQRRVGATFVHVTHDQEEAMAIADRIVVMNAGRIEDEGGPERVYRRPRTRFAAAFLGEMNFIDGHMAGGRAITALGPLPIGERAAGGSAVTVCIRPEQLGPGHAHRVGNATVTETMFQGAHRRARVVPENAKDIELLARLPVGTKASVGDTVPLSVDLDAVTLLDEGAGR